MIITISDYPNTVEALNLVIQETVFSPLYLVETSGAENIRIAEKEIGLLRKDLRCPELPEHPPHVRPDLKYDSEYAVFLTGDPQVVELMFRRKPILEEVYKTLQEVAERYLDNLESARKPSGLPAAHRTLQG